MQTRGLSAGGAGRGSVFPPWLVTLRDVELPYLRSLVWTRQKNPSNLSAFTMFYLTNTRNSLWTPGRECLGARVSMCLRTRAQILNDVELVEGKGVRESALQAEEGVGRPGVLGGQGRRNTWNTLHSHV